MMYYQFSARKLLTVILTAASLVLANSVFVQAESVLDVYFTADIVSDVQPVQARVDGADQNSCYSHETASFYWQGDTLFGEISTAVSPPMGGCLMIYIPWSYASTETVKAPGTYYLRFIEHFTEYDISGTPFVRHIIYRDTLVVKSCDPCKPGDVNHDGTISISDVTAMVAFMFGTDYSPPCPSQANCNGDASQDISDLTALVTYMFKSGAPPICP